MVKLPVNSVFQLLMPPEATIKSLQTIHSILTGFSAVDVNIINKPIKVFISNVDPKSLIPTQEFVDTYTLQYHKDKNKPNEEPQIIRIGQYNFLLDGHHRAYIALTDATALEGCIIYEYKDAQSIINSLYKSKPLI